MSLKKIFGYFVIIPFLATIFIEAILKGVGLRLEVDTFNSIRYLLLIFSILGSVFLLIRNFLTRKSGAWFVLALISMGFLLYAFYFLNSLSHAGF